VKDKIDIVQEKARELGNEKEETAIKKAFEGMSVKDKLLEEFVELFGSTKSIHENITKINDWLPEALDKMHEEGKREGIGKMMVSVLLWRPHMYEEKVTKEDKEEMSRMYNELLKENK